MCVSLIKIINICLNAFNLRSQSCLFPKTACSTQTKLLYKDSYLAILLNVIAINSMSDRCDIQVNLFCQVTANSFEKCIQVKPFHVTSSKSGFYLSQKPENNEQRGNLMYFDFKYCICGVRRLNFHPELKKFCILFSFVHRFDCTTQWRRSTCYNCPTTA